MADEMKLRLVKATAPSVYHARLSLPKLKEQLGGCYFISEGILHFVSKMNAECRYVREAVLDALESADLTHVDVSEYALNPQEGVYVFSLPSSKEALEAILASEEFEIIS